MIALPPTRRTAVTSSGPRICLRRYPLAPARTAEKRASSSANEVSIKHLSSGMAARKSRQTSMPLPPGRRTSSTATSGRVGGTLVIASSASDASPTTWKPSWASNSSRSPRRTISWSSSRKILMGTAPPKLLSARLAGGANQWRKDGPASSYCDHSNAAKPSAHLVARPVSNQLLDVWALAEQVDPGAARPAEACCSTPTAGGRWARSPSSPP